MSNFQYNVDDRFQTQEAIRTIHFSFKPHLPFTAAYEMALQNAGGGKLVADPNKLNYFRLAPRDIKGSENPDSTGNDSSYKWTTRRQLYSGTGSGRLQKMAESQNREENVKGVLPDTSTMTSALGRELASLLNVDYKTKNPSFNPAASRDKTEMELKMIAEGFDKIAGTKGGLGQKLNDSFRPTFTDRSGRGFDIDLTKYEKLSDYVESIAGDKFNDMEITKAETKVLSSFKGADKVTKTNKVKWEQHIDKVFDRYNDKITEMYSMNEGVLDSGFLPTQALRGADSFDYARSIATTAGDTNSLSDNYNIRQILDRFARNNMKPYIFQAQLAPDRWGMVAIVPKINAKGIPQFARGATSVVTTSANLQAGFTSYLKTLDGISKQEVTKHVAKVKRIVNQQIVLTKERIATLEKYSSAMTSLDVAGNITTVLNTDGPDQVHKIQNLVAGKMLADIKSYFKGAEMQGRFKDFYEKLLIASNSLTQSWFRNSSTLVGKVTGQPLSDEFKYGKAWDGPRKKYIGVWSSPTEDTWKGSGKGYNFSVAPILEARRALSSNLDIQSSYGD